MGLWQRIKAAVSGRKRRGTGLEVARWSAAPPRRGTAQLLTGYGEMPWLRACVEKHADAVAGVCWRVFHRVGKDGKAVRDYGLRSAYGPARAERMKALRRSGELVESPDHLMLRVLADPNPYLSGRTVTKLIQLHLELVGEAFLALERMGKYVVGFWPVPPSAVMAVPDYTKPAAEQVFMVSMGNVTKLIPASEMIHLRNPDPIDPLGRGIGPAFALGDELDTAEYVSRFMKNSFWNNCMPAAIVTLEGMTNPADPNVKAFKESLLREHQGPEKAGKVMITGGKGVSMARLDTSFKDMDLVALLKFLMGFQRMTYTIPPELMGDVSNSNRASAHAAKAFFAEEGTQPRMEFLRAEYQRALMPLFDEDAILDFESPIPADRDHELKVATAAPWSRAINEWRELQGLRPLPEFEGKFPPLNMPGQVDPAGQVPSPEPGSPAADAAREKAFEAPALFRNSV